MTFNEACEALKEGERITRQCWIDSPRRAIELTDYCADDWFVAGVSSADAPAPHKESDTSTPENRAEAIGKALGTALAPLALLNARPGDKPPEVHVNIWTIH